jgi:predicted nucleic acid-binding protein
MIAPVFVDSNVLVYSQDNRDAVKKARAREWLDYLWREGSGRTSTQVLNEYYVTVTRKVSPRISAETAWDDVRVFSAWNPLPLDMELLDRARAVETRHRLSWWDSLIVAAAEAQNCGILLSEDLQDGLTVGITTVLNPFTSRISEVRASYAAAPAPRSRHRPRGRPKRLVA